jgi:hypothetical protein
MATLSAGNLQAILEAIDAQLTTILSGGGLVGGVILEDGTVPMTANWDFGGFDLENVGDLYVNDTLYIVDNSTGSLSLSGDDIILKNLNGSSGNLILDVSSGDIVIQNDGTTMIETNGTDGITITGKAIAAQLNLPHAAFAPAANGDIWTTTLGLFARISGVTQKMPAVTAGGASITLDQTGGPVTWTWFWTKMDDVVTITPASSPSGTSTGATIFTLSGIPANLRPTTTSVTVRTDILDNGTIERAVMVIGTGGTATLSRWTGTAYSPNTFWNALKLDYCQNIVFTHDEIFGTFVCDFGSSEFSE